MMLRPPVWFAVLLVLAAVFVLFQVKYKVQGLKQDLAEVNRQLGLEKESLHVLKAEWAFLSKPERIRKLATRHLYLQPASYAQLRTQEHLHGAPLPKKRQVVARDVIPVLKPIKASARVYR